MLDYQRKFLATKSHFLILSFTCCAFLISCGGGGGGGKGSKGNGGGEGGVSAPAKETVMTVIELIDPTPGETNEFGSETLILGNGNIVVASPGDSSLYSNNGAVHLYNGSNGELISSIYGDAADDRLGSFLAALHSNSISSLDNYYTIASPFDDRSSGGPKTLENAGSVRLMDGNTGLEVAVIYGDDDGDSFGSQGVTPLPNGNFVVTSSYEDFEASGIVLADVGSVRLFDGSTGEAILPVFRGNSPGDRVGTSGITPLSNSNYIVKSSRVNVGGAPEAGAVHLFNGATADLVGTPIRGGIEDDKLARVTVLSNDNYVVFSSEVDIDGLTDAGAAQLVSGATGMPIGPLITGNASIDSLGSNGVTALANGNFVITSGYWNDGAGRVALFSGETGLVIGVPIEGLASHQDVGSGKTAALPNGNYVIASPREPIAGVANVGSVRLVNGQTGVMIGSMITGKNENDYLSGSSFTAEGVIVVGDNFVINSPAVDVSGINGAGSVQLVNGATGDLIGNAVEGSNEFDAIGSGGVKAVTAVGGTNYIIGSPSFESDGREYAGSIHLVNGSNGEIIGDPINGLTTDDNLGDGVGSGYVVALSNELIAVVSTNEYVFKSGFSGRGGKLRLINGETGGVSLEITGDHVNDMKGHHISTSVDETFFVFALPNADKDELEDSGTVFLVTP